MDYNYQIYLDKQKYGLNEIDLNKPKNGVNNKDLEVSEKDLEKIIEELNNEFKKGSGNE